jgi:hypothetical protein
VGYESKQQRKDDRRQSLYLATLTVLLTLPEFSILIVQVGPPLWSSVHGSWLLTQRSRVRFPATPEFLSRSGSGTGSTQPL